VTGADLLLARFAWRDEADAAKLRDRIGRAAELQVFRSIDGGEGYAYLESSHDGSPIDRGPALCAALTGATVARLSLLMTVEGASAGTAAPYRYVVETDVAAGREEDFNAWYDDEHLAGLASVPGTVRAARYRSEDGHPRYHACYDLVRPETLGSPAWLAVRATPWSDRVRPTFVNTKRTMFRRCETAPCTTA
jgi:hypothetical protein